MAALVLALAGCAQQASVSRHHVAAPASLTAASSSHPATTSADASEAASTVPVTTTKPPAVPTSTASATDDPGVIPWIDVSAPGYQPPQPLPTPPLPRTAKACSAAQVSVHDAGSSGRTQDRGAVLQFTNISNQTCLLYGRPPITLTGPGFGPALLRQTTDEDPGTSYDMPPGQTTWLWLSARDGCEIDSSATVPLVTRLKLSMPGGGAVSLNGLSLPRGCGGIAESSFRRVTPDTPVAPAVLEGAMVSLRLPPGPIRAGSVLAYTATMRNPTARALPMVPCPGYRQRLSIGTPSKEVAWRLNCDGHTSLPAGSELAFSMRLQVPADAPTGSADLYWSLNTDPSKGGGASAQVQIAGDDIPCRAGQLSASAPSAATAFDVGSNLYQPKDAGSALTVVVTNTSGSRCSLQGAPTVSVTAADGSPLALTFDNEAVQDGRSLSPQQVWLTPGGSARTVLSWHATWCQDDPNPVTLALGLASGSGDVPLRPSDGWTPPSCRGFDFGTDLSSTQFG